jgi:RimJ/RimL family protein N-acetyltransferase
MELIAILKDGTPERAVGDLSPSAPEDGSCVGTCGFKSVPRDGRVEIAYFSFPGNEGRGVATRMAAALVEIARGTDARVAVAAQTLPQESASTSVLKKLGFEHVDTLEHPEDGTVWEWRRRDGHPRR